MAEKLHLKRCSSCNQWTDGDLKACEHCGHEHNKAYKEALHKRRQAEDIHIPVWRTKPEDPVWLKVVKRPVQAVQLALYGIVAFLIYLSTAFAH